MRLKELQQELRTPRDERSRDSARGEVWLLLNAAISRYIRSHGARLSKISREDVEDIAAEKSLDLLRRMESGNWEIDGRVPSQIAAFLSAVARNGLLNHLRKARRTTELQEGSDLDVEHGDRQVPASSADSPDLLVQRRDFALALRSCAEQLERRARMIWFLRVFCSLSSKEIARHPAVSIKASHVDVVLQRTRRAIRDCMRRRGFEPQDMLPGSFAELWRAFQGEWG